MSDTHKIAEMTKAVRENGITDDTRALIHEAYEAAQAIPTKQPTTTTPTTASAPQQPTDAATEARQAMIDRMSSPDKDLHLNRHSGKTIDPRNLGKE